MKLSVIIPIFNEKDNISILSKKLDNSLKNFNYEVIFINDGSTDGSEKKILSMIKKYRNYNLVNFKKNYGQTAAIQAGFDISKGNIIVALDGDLQNDPADIPKLIAKINSGYDVVSGWRKNRKDSNILRVLPSKVANFIISKISGVALHDYGCTLKAYRREVVEGIRLYGEMHRFIPIYASWEGGKVTEIVVKHFARNAGKSKYGISRAPKVVLDLIVIKFFDSLISRPIHLFGKLGFYLIIFAFLITLYAMWLKFFENISSSPVAATERPI